jgi:cryptochrome
MPCGSSQSLEVPDLMPARPVRIVPQAVLPKLWKQWEVTHLVFEKDIGAYARDRDNAVARMAEKAGIEVVVKQE